MGVLARTVNTLRRTAEAFLPRLARPGDGFAREWLTPSEFGLWQRMDVRDRAHSAFVARRLLAADEAARPELVAAALLHDSAKALLPFHPLHRIIVHVWPGPTVKEAPLGTGLRGARQLKQHHETLGARLIRDAGGREEVAALVAALADAEAAGADVASLREADSAT